MSHYVTEKLLKKGMTNQESVAAFAEMAPGYNQHIVETIKYRAHIKAGELMNQLFPNKDDVKVLDVACGTGLVAKEMKTAGFTHIDGVDPCDALLLQARDTGCYNQLVSAYMGLDDSKLPFEDDTYDAATLIGGLGENMMPCKGIYELVRLVKPGGYIILINREEILSIVDEYKDRLEPMFDALERDGKWKRVARTVYPEFLCDKTGIIYIYQMC